MKDNLKLSRIEKLLEQENEKILEINLITNKGISQIMNDNEKIKNQITSYLTCECGSKLFLTSIIPENGQVNFVCSGEECNITGFISRGRLYFTFVPPLSEG